ncbi:MAG TPA: energy transducer TonB [Acidisarcina sp.]
MFEDSMMESAGTIAPNSKWMIFGSVALQGAMLVALLIFPLLYPDALPRLTTPELLIAPPQSQAPLPPREPQPSLAPQRSAVMLLDLTNAPAHIGALQRTASTGIDNEPPAPPGAMVGQLATGIAEGMPNILSAAPAPVVRAAPKGPMRVSSGVAAGQLLGPIRPVYPRMAVTARVQGTVIVAATISRLGTIENARIMSGPALLQGAAIEAIRRARYRPFVLNGEAIEVETTISVVFTLGG